MNTSCTISALPTKNVLEMTDEEIKESYHLFFPDIQLPEPTAPGSIFGEFGEFQKLSFLKDVPTHYSASTKSGA